MLIERQRNEKAAICNCIVCVSPNTKLSFHSPSAASTHPFPGVCQYGPPTPTPQLFPRLLPHLSTTLRAAICIDFSCLNSAAPTPTPAHHRRHVCPTSPSSHSHCCASASAGLSCNSCIPRTFT
ncbi:hypothetical protein M427DRAFT_331612 [Gonapodya prolifera JEL478]|uniref:Uncharacterized protein n=1 Tax=Gonapodya prolifera (strain JEL478) TaxID=1344416 RepID=A0A139AEI1_GONPJ|nr:hypothetical protein M427DRAFT_331612 [Gonapodya prolifera JEL478]|eukprot:KXS15177.1 hypothetical protein M427DRAFT_331612 [Gonapodya prolifera JEL478]